MIRENNPGPGTRNPLTLYWHIETAQQRTIIPKYGDWYTGR